jgi:hypothetical protein
VDLLATKDLTAEARERLEAELKNRGLTDLETRVTEARTENAAFIEYERERGQRTPSGSEFAALFSLWIGIGLCLGAAFQFIFDQPFGYHMLLTGLAVAAGGGWLLWRSRAARRGAT